MIKPAVFSKVNFVFGKPRTMADKDCGQLPVHRDTDNNRVISLWVGSFMDRLKFLIYGELWLVVRGNVQPPLAITVDYPWNEPRTQGIAK